MDKDQAEPAAPGDNRMRWIIGAGIGIVAIIGASFALTAGDSDPKWSDDPSAVTSSRAAASPATKPSTPQTAASQSVAANGDIRGMIQSKAEATISSRVTARITAMPYKSGESFAGGALLAAFDCSQTRAQLNAADAATAAYRKTYDTNIELDAYKAIGTNDVAVSKANFEKAAAEAKAISSQLVDCSIRAPFPGRVVEQIAHPHEVAASGQPMMKIQNSTDLEVQLIVPSRWLTWLKPGTSFTFKVDETAATLNARVARLGASVDPVSKTLRVIGALAPTGGVVLPGMSGSAIFNEPKTSGGV